MYIGQIITLQGCDFSSLNLKGVYSSHLNVDNKIVQHAKLGEIYPLLDSRFLLHPPSVVPEQIPFPSPLEHYVLGFFFCVCEHIGRCHNAQG